MREEYNKDYREREYEKFSGLDPQQPKKKPSFLTALLVGLLVLLVCSLGYDNIIKPYLEKKEQPVYSLSIIAAMAIILFLTGMYYSCKRGYIIPSRIDLQVEIQPGPFSDLAEMSPGEPSSAIRARVEAARAIQSARFADVKGVHCNAQMSEKMLQTYCTLSDNASALLRNAMERLDLSARAYSRILKVARTIADLAGEANIQPNHIAEAVGYRNLDRASWGE